MLDFQLNNFPERVQFRTKVKTLFAWKTYFDLFLFLQDTSDMRSKEAHMAGRERKEYRMKYLNNKLDSCHKSLKRYRFVGKHHFKPDYFRSYPLYKGRIKTHLVAKRLTNTKRISKPSKCYIS